MSAFHLSPLDAALLEDDGNLAEVVGGLELSLLAGSRVQRGIKAGPERERMAGY